MYIPFSEERNGFGNMSDTQLDMLRIRFSFAERGTGFPENFSTWNNLRESDGFLCRFDEDCQWIMKDKWKFVCQEEDVSPSVEVL